MAQNKFGEELPEDEEGIKRRLFELKQEYFALVRQGAPVAEVDAVRMKAAQLEAWRKHLNNITDYR